MVKDRVIVTVGSTKYGGKVERTFKIQGGVELDPNSYGSNWIVESLGEKSAKILLDAMKDFRRGGQHADGLTAKAFQQYQNKLVGRLRYHAETDTQKKFVDQLQRGWNKAIGAGKLQSSDRQRLETVKERLPHLEKALADAPKGSEAELKARLELEDAQQAVRHLTPRVTKSLREGFNHSNRTHIRPDRYADKNSKNRIYVVGDAPKKLSPEEVQARKEYNAARGVNVPVGNKIHERKYGSSRESLDNLMALVDAFKKLESYGGKKYELFDVNNPQNSQQEKLAQKPEYLAQHAKAVAMLAEYDAEHNINGSAFNPAQHPKAQGAIEPRFTTIQQINAARANYGQVQAGLQDLAKKIGADLDEPDSLNNVAEEAQRKAEEATQATPPAEESQNKTEEVAQATPPTETPKKKTGTPKKPRTPRKPKAAKPAPVDAHKVVQDRIFNSPEDANKFIQQSMTTYPAAEKKIQNWMQKNNITAASSAKDSNVIPWVTPDMSFAQKKQLNAIRAAVIDIQVAQGDGANNIEKMKGQKAIKFLQGQGYNDPKKLKLQSKNEAAAELSKKQQKPQTWEENPYAPREVLLTYIEDIRIEDDKGPNPINIEKLTRMRELANEIRKIKANDIEAFNRLEEDSGPDFKGLFDFARKINAHVKKNWED